MGTTSAYGFRYQDPGSSPDGAALGKNLAEDVEAKIILLDTAFTGVWAVNTTQDNDINALEAVNAAFGFQFVRKTADETVTSNTTPQLDNDLAFSATGGQRYLVEVTLFVEVAGGNSTTDFRGGFLMPVGAAAAFGGIGPDPSMTTGSPFGGGEWEALYGTGTGSLRFGLYSGGTTHITVKGIITMGVNSGTVTFAWSQDVASANGVTVKANSYMKVNKVA